MRLTLSGQTDDNQGLKNMVFVHPDTHKQLGSPQKVILQGKHVYHVGQDPGLDAGTLGLSSPQRSGLSLRESDIGAYDLKVEAYQPKRGVNTSMVLLKVLVGTFSKRAVIVDADSIAETIREKWNHLVFCKNQKFVLQCDKMWLRITVEKCMVADVKATGGVSSVAIGTFNANVTDVSCSAEPGTSKFPNNVEIKEAENNRPFGEIDSWKGEDLGIGGMDKQFGDIFRRAFAPRLYPADILKKMGVKHCRGMLLYGPPGTGKTLIARVIGKLLKAREPKIVNGPEIFNKYVGESEAKIRELFKDAQDDYRLNGDKADLHMIIFDEIDAICKSRGSQQGGAGAGDNVVNQLLSIIDGVDALNNILVVGMTNRRDLIDEALLRPGRLEITIEIGLPDEEGRRQIFRIHSKKMRDNGYMDDAVDTDDLAKRTENYSGAEIEGLINSARSFAMNRNIDQHDLNNIDMKKLRNVKVTKLDFERALLEVKPAFGVAQKDLIMSLKNGIIRHSKDFNRVYDSTLQLMHKLKRSKREFRHAVLMHGDIGSGKTALVSDLATASGYPFVKVVSADQMVGMSDYGMMKKISNTFEDAYKSNLSIVILDDIERLLSFSRVGPRYKNDILQTLKVLCRKRPPEDRHIFIFATSSGPAVDILSLGQYFDTVKSIPNVVLADSVEAVIEGAGFNLDKPETMDAIKTSWKTSMPIKKLISLLGFCLDEETDMLTEKGYMAGYKDATRDHHAFLSLTDDEKE